MTMNEDDHDQPDAEREHGDDEQAPEMGLHDVSNHDESVYADAPTTEFLRCDDPNSVADEHGNFPPLAE